jgi:signal peptidase I
MQIAAAAHRFYDGFAHRDAKMACSAITQAYWQAARQAADAAAAAAGGAKIQTGDCAAALGDMLRAAPASSLRAPSVTVSPLVVRGNTATGVGMIGKSSEPMRFVRAPGGVWQLDCCTGAQLDSQPLVTYRVASANMLPTLHVGQIVSVDNTAYKHRHPKLGDVVTFHPPVGADNSADPICGNPAQGGQQGGAGQQACDKPTPAESDQTFIKRVVGLPGDTLSIINGHVIRDGVREKDPYIEPCGGAPTCTYQKPIKVPAGMYYMMGDNRGGSDDSRFWGPVPERWIIGRIVSH